MEMRDLIDLFYECPDELGSWEEVSRDVVPQPFRNLLVHDGHMTETIEAHYGERVDVDVLSVVDEGPHYARKILLRRQSDAKVVQFGIVRLDPQSLPERSMCLIRQQVVPLGRILVDHEVMRRVQVDALWRIAPGIDLQQLLKIGPDTPLYGRTAVIFCNHQPAIQLLEIPLAMVR